MKKYVPYVTMALVLVNVLIFYIMGMSGNYNEIVEKYSMYVPAVENGEWYRNKPNYINYRFV